MPARISGSIFPKKIKTINMPQGKYKRTGNIAVDMVAACKDHYAKQGVKVEKVYLSKSYWVKFNNYIKKQVPGHIDEGFIDFDDTIVVESTIIQSDPMHFALEGSRKKQKFDA